MSNILSFQEFANKLPYTIKVEIEVDYETIATTEIEITPDHLYEHYINTDEVIEWLGKMERGVLETDIKTRYEEYLESENGNG
jgi:hypothetical protein